MAAQFCGCLLSCSIAHSVALISSPNRGSAKQGVGSQEPVQKDCASQRAISPQNPDNRKPSTRSRLSGDAGTLHNPRPSGDVHMDYTSFVHDGLNSRDALNGRKPWCHWTETVSASRDALNGWKPWCHWTETVSAFTVRVPASAARLDQEPKPNTGSSGAGLAGSPAAGRVQDGGVYAGVMGAGRMVPDTRLGACRKEVVEPSEKIGRSFTSFL